MLLEKLTRPSSGRLFLVLMVGLAVAVALSMAMAGDAEAKKKKGGKKHHKSHLTTNFAAPGGSPPGGSPPGGSPPGGSPPGGPGPNPSCNQVNGTSGNDNLLGTNNCDEMFGGEGDDSYRGLSGPDKLVDTSATSNDTYILPHISFDTVVIEDSGGNNDVVDLAEWSVNDFTKTLNDTNGDGKKDEMSLDGPGGIHLRIKNAVDQFVYGPGKIETFKFLEGNRTPSQIN
jgi:hypothetical protein